MKPEQTPPAAEIDRLRYSKPDSELEVLFGLPREVQFCRKCNISNQQPMSSNEYKHSSDSIKRTMGFDAEGICRACRFHERKRDGSIDWERRESELRDLCNAYRKNDGSYDCIIGGSGGKDSAMQSHLLKYKYGMNPLTVTWSPHLYTDIGWQNFQNWVHKGGFDNFLFTPNGKIHRLLTRNATIKLLHPFQPFILGQKTFVTKMAVRLGIPLIFYGEMPGEYGEDIDENQDSFDSDNTDDRNEGFTLDFVGQIDKNDIMLGGVAVGEYLDQGVTENDLASYLPLGIDILKKHEVCIKYLGYYLNWVPQEAFYYAVENTGFCANPVRTEGTYSKYNSIDDKIDGFFYYTRWIKFGVGRAMMDSSQEVRNGHLEREEGASLIHSYDGEYPSRYEKEFLDYIGMSRNEFFSLCDEFRSPHLWSIEDNKWALRHSPTI